MTTQQQPGADLALPSEQPKPPTLSQRIVGLEQQLALAAPRGVEAQQIIRDALTLLAKTPRLGECEPSTVLGGLMTMGQLGLRPGVLGHGWLIPFRNKRAGRMEAQLVIGYQGLVELAYRSQQIERVTARTVHANDVFEVEYGTNERLVHKPARGDRGAPVAYYATVKLRTASSPMFYDLSIEQARVYRDRFAMARDRQGNVVGPWKDHFDAMAQKTCFRQLSKYVPKGTDLATALAVDDTIRVDLTPTADPTHVSQHLEIEGGEETEHVGDDLPVEDSSGQEG
jgi:recombination protein RecT